eukprot:5512215-Pyramimonas_sp.AAC.2
MKGYRTVGKHGEIRRTCHPAGRDFGSRDSQRSEHRHDLRWAHLEDHEGARAADFLVIDAGL